MSPTDEHLAALAYSQVLPSHYVVGQGYRLHRAMAGGYALPIRDEWGDAFHGHCIVRAPRSASKPDMHPDDRLRRCDLHRDSLWMYDHCVRSRNTLEKERPEWRLRPKAAPAYSTTARVLR